MLFSGMNRTLAGRARAALLVLSAAAVLAACKHNMTTTANTKGLWIANGPNVVEFVPSQMTGGVQNVMPKHSILSGAFGAPQGVTFDAMGNLWVMDPEANVNGTPTPALLKFTSAQLSALGMSNMPEPTAWAASAIWNNAASARNDTANAITGALSGACRSRKIPISR